MQVATRSAAGAAADPRVRRVFDHFDKDGDGKLGRVS
jgi:Ca2+-binding EF-hand superfamily protein